MDAIWGAADGFLGFKGRKDDDFIDRLSSRYTVVVILICTAISTVYPFIGSLITCWCPVHFTGSHIKFTNSYCWVKNTYYLPYGEEIPKVHEDEKRQVVTYYQWIPFILLFQALLFYLPSVVWHGLNQKGGIDSDNILATANKLHKTEEEDSREGMLKLLSSQLHRFLGTRKTVGGGRGVRGCIASLCTMCGRRVGSYLVILYMISKVLYIGNIFFQLFMLNQILGANFSNYGIDVLKGAWTDHDWHDAPGVIFPRVTMCDFNIRRLGNVHRYTVQCALPLNLFNEKVYVFLWFWFVFVLICTLMGFLTWLVRSLFSKDRLLFIQNHLKLEDRLMTDHHRRLSEKFVIEYLRQDGTFILRLIAHNTNHITTTDVICNLWDHWVAKYADNLNIDTPDSNKPYATGDEKKPLDDSEGVHV